jgi:hypothetical protein
MANIVEQIISGVKTVAADQLGATYQEIPFVFEVEKNNVRTARLGYGVRPLEANFTTSVNKTYALDHRFELVLSDTIARTDSNVQHLAAINTMYDKADEIFKDLVQTKVGLPTLVLNVFDPSLSEPELLDENKIVILRMQFTVKYRSSLT